MISRQEIDSKLMVPNRSVIVIGGLITESERDGVSGLPILSRIPFLRHLFSNNSTENDRTELLVFIQPFIINGTDDLVDGNQDQIRRTVLGEDALNFTKPPIDTSDLLPLESDAPDASLFPILARHAPEPRSENASRWHG
ncbi:MAG: hypothetical protein R3F11_25470 [Verrucomicrobiales bacterium]